MSIDPAANRVVVGPGDKIDATEAEVGNVTFPSGEVPAGPFRAEVRVRHRSAEVPATIHPRADRTARVVFDRPVRAVAPGQSCVFYRGDVVLGGGVLRR